MTLAIAHSRGWLDYEAPVCKYWPEFSQNGTEYITVRQLLAHQAGLFALDTPLDRLLVAHPDKLAAVLARQKAAWPPGARQAYHAITLGFYESEILRRIDPEHRTLGTFFQDEIATPLRLGAYIRLPLSIPDEMLAPIENVSVMRRIAGFPLRFLVETLNPHSNIVRALNGSELVLDEKHIYARNLEIPSGGGVCSARGIAHAYSVFANGGAELGLRQQTLDLLAAPARPSAHGFHDECMKSDVRFSLGFMKTSPNIPFGGPRSYGAPGAGGAMGFADPDARVGYGYVTCGMGTALEGDPRDRALRDAFYQAYAITA
jgi:CubicO group peptidase (beta-lactamase class C family)